MPETSLLHQSFRLLLPAVVALLAIAAPAHGQWYLESSIDITGLDYAITGSNPGTGMDFALSGNTAVVSGARDAYIFERNAAGQWSRTTTFNVVPNSTSVNYFPVQVAIDGDNVAVSSYNSPTSYVLHRDAPGTWSSASLAGSAMDIDISGNTALLCYKGDWGGYTIGQRIFDRQSDGSWTQSAILPTGVGSRGDFGTAGAISGNQVIIGETNYAYVYGRDATGAWSQTATLINRLVGGFGYGVGLDGSLAVIGGWPQIVYKQNDSGTWQNDVSLGGGGGMSAAVEGDNLISVAPWVSARRLNANGYQIELQDLGRPATNWNYVQAVSIGNGKLGVVRSDKLIDVYTYDSGTRLFYGTFSNTYTHPTTLADLSFTAHSRSLAGVPDSSGSVTINGYLAFSRYDLGTVGVSKTLDCDEQVTFTFDFVSINDGSLQLTLGGVVLDTITSPGAYRRTFTLADLGLTPGQLEWNLDFTNNELSGWANIDNLYITTIPEPATLSLLGLGMLGLRRRR